MKNSYYLEANALIAISADELLGLKNINVYTSSVAVLEFIKGLSVDNFEKRKIKLDVICNHLFIDWESVNQKMMELFGGYMGQSIEENSYRLKQYVELLLKCNDHSEFLSKIGKTDLSYKNLCVCLLNQTIPIGEILSVEYMNYLPGGAVMTASESNIFINSCKFYRHNYLNKTADKNDIVDIIHTLYLKDLTTTIVTNDRKLSKICRRGARINTLNVSEFRLLLNSI